MVQIGVKFSKLLELQQRRENLGADEVLDENKNVHYIYIIIFMARNMQVTPYPPLNHGPIILFYDAPKWSCSVLKFQDYLLISH